VSAGPTDPRAESLSLDDVLDADTAAENQKLQRKSANDRSATSESASRVGSGEDA
jgi:hypothetical protein